MRAKIQKLTGVFPVTLDKAVYVSGTKRTIKEEIADIKANLSKLENPLRIDVVKDLGIVPEQNSSEIKSRNASLLKASILENKYANKYFYFPIGNYHFDLIEIEEQGPIAINIIGESGGNINSSKPGYPKVSIRADQGFINITTPHEKNPNNNVLFMVKNLLLTRGEGYHYKPEKMCFGVTNNNGFEYNFIFENIYIHGFEYGFKSPGYTCGGSSTNNVSFSHCKYGIYIGEASHFLNIKNIDLLYCYHGIRLSVGGNPCNISSVHVATGCFTGMQDYLTEDPKMYAIHTKGGLVIDGLYYEQYSGDADVENFTLIDYEGWGNGSVGKLIVKNSPIGNMGAGKKGKFFTGSTYLGAGPETGELNARVLRKNNRDNYFSSGCVDFQNCIISSTRQVMLNTIKSSIKIDNQEGPINGYTFDGEDLFAGDVIFTKKYSRYFNSYINNAVFNTDSNLVRLSYNNIQKAEYDGCQFDRNPIYDNEENTTGTLYKGVITVTPVTDPNTDVKFGILGNKNGQIVLVRELDNIKYSKNNKSYKIIVEEYIPKSEARGTFFGYISNGDKNNIISNNDMTNIVYNIGIISDPAEFNNEPISKSIVAKEMGDNINISDVSPDEIMELEP